MKYLLPVFLVLFSAVTFTSCSKDDDDNPEKNEISIVGRWQLDYEEITYDGETKVSTEDPETASIVNFYEDGTVIIEMDSSDGRVNEEYTYKVSADGRYLSVMPDTEEDGPFSVEQLTDRLLVLSITYSTTEHIVSTFKRID